VAVGRLWEPKDYPNLLRAVAALQTPTRLLIVGDGPLRSALELLAVTLGVSDRICFLGVRHDIPAILSACDIFVLSSAWEGFGLVVAEAMACERPVVATDCGGVREVVGDVGWLVPVKDSSALCGALGAALSLDAAWRLDIGKRGRKRVVEKYSLEKTAERHLGVYQGN
jgi:glycosyltransferase involved in cell wall biosynthesis